MKLSELRTRVRAYLQEVDENGRFSNDTLNLFLNDALAQIADRTDAFVDDQSALVFAGTASIELPVNTLGVKVVRWNDIRLDETTQEYLDTLDANWIEKTGRPERFYTTTPNVVRFVPIPSEDGTVRIRRTRTPVTLVDDNDESELPDFLAMLAPVLATYLALDSDEKLGQADRWLARFERDLQLAQRRLATRISVASGMRVKTEIRRRY